MISGLVCLLALANMACAFKCWLVTREAAAARDRHRAAAIRLEVETERLRRMTTAYRGKTTGPHLTFVKGGAA